MIQLTLHSASACHAAGRSQRTAWLQRAQIADELPCAVFPGTLERETPARLAGNAERAEAGASQIGVQSSHRVVRDHVQRARDRKGGNRRTAAERVELNDAEGGGQAREDKDVRRGQMRGQVLTGFFA